MARKKEHRPLPIILSITLAVCLVASACTAAASNDPKPREYSQELRITPLSNSCAQLLARAKAVEDDYYAALKDPEVTDEQLNLAITFNLEVIQKLVRECPEEQATRVAKPAITPTPMPGEPTPTFKAPPSGSDLP